MKASMLTLIVGALVLGGCATGSAPVSETPVVEQPAAAVEPAVVVEPAENSLITEAHRCLGQIKYQAEMQQGELRSRLSCEWTAQPAAAEGSWQQW